MKKIITYFGIASMLVALSTSCGSKKTTSIGAFYSHETECMDCESDGTETLFVWGTGKNKSDAMDQAKKNAVEAVLFKGVSKGTGQCSVRPLVLEVNAREKYETYFNKFFKDGGKYKKFVSMSDKKRGSELKEKNGQEERFGFVIRVQRPKLKEQLIKDEILKK